MTVMMLNGLLYCLLFMLTSAEMGPHSKLTAGLHMYGKASRVDIQARSRRCKNLDGLCIPRAKPCPDDLPLETGSGSPYCNQVKRCCYPEPTINPEDCLASDGCFFLYSSSQCFCYIDAQAITATWTEAEQQCSNRGWQLPHPIDVVELRSALFQKYGNIGDVWLIARCPLAPYNMFWQDNGVEITDVNPFFATVPANIAVGICLETHVTAAAITAHPDKPYFTDICDDNHNVIICEKKW